jgi:hypothetical protein
MTKSFHISIENVGDKTLRVRYGEAGQLEEETVAPGLTASIEADETWKVEVSALEVDNGQPEPGTDTRGA